ncbi:ARF GTPase-activating protein GIT2a isoform X5 [Astyanax mexicanus]|uniref:ARF GTPase-activating protein GIT2a isoform X5 n=1 Tax=Astyanax mexicanus TaxID=7994 RepID=UPI0020CAE921|nr:ARF GTPase-activating protein GIT2a isoform X5 [Astyanax mexicanus]
MSKRGRSGEACADCGLPDPHWASVNRAVLICDQCCSVHRSLGRHSSQIRHLVHTVWSPTQLQMVRTLFKSGSNSIWEHSLQDSSSAASGRKKNIPQDKLHPNKAEFIRAKYQMLAFILRMPCRDDDSCTAKDLSKQLHSSVRTGNLETSLRLLSLGAQANFFHPEKGNTPLHVAAKAGQVSQVELLSVYGADPGAPDANGNTPIEYARQAGHPDLADRLVEIQYELTDRLAFYLCGRRPDHKNGQHFIIPQLADSNQDLSELRKAAKLKLQSLSNRLFEELAMDVYDEVDRRETDAVWLTTQSHSTLVAEAVIVPFLPVNPEYSSTRNQGRQKLARFNAHEFATLIIDILSDAMRRQHGNSATSPKDELILKRASSRHASDSQEPDQPDYDSVASDEDTDAEVHPAKTGRAKSLDSDQSDGPVTVQDFLEVKNALLASEAKIEQLMKANVSLTEELRLLQKKLLSLQSENSSLRSQVPSQTPRAPEALNPPVPLKTRPMSMYETSSGLRPFLPKGDQQLQSEEISSLQPFLTQLEQGVFTSPHFSTSSLPSSLSSSRTLRCPPAKEFPPLSSSLPPSLLSSTSSSALHPSPSWCCHLGCISVSKADKQSSVSEGDYDNTVHDSELEDPGLDGKSRLQGLGWGEGPDGQEAEPNTALPATEDVIQKTEQITKNIQALLKAAQESQPSSKPCEARDGVRRLRHSLGCFSTLMPWAEKPPSPLQPLGLRSSATSSCPKTPISPNNPASCFISCAERIHLAVSDMAALFPKKPRSESVGVPLRLLKSSAQQLQLQCRKTSAQDGVFMQQIIQCAYDIARAAKQLVTVTTKENSK